MIVPHEQVDQDGQHFADIPDDRKRGGADDGAQRK